MQVNTNQAVVGVRQGQTDLDMLNAGESSKSLEKQGAISRVRVRRLLCRVCYEGGDIREVAKVAVRIYMGTGCTRKQAEAKVWGVVSHLISALG